MDADVFISALSPALFWDVDSRSLDGDKHAAYIAERVLTRGTLDDFRLLKAHYGKPKIKRIAKKIRYMDDRTLHFCSAYFNVPIPEFRCYILRQSNQAHWNY